MKSNCNAKADEIRLRAKAYEIGSELDAIQLRFEFRSRGTRLPSSAA